MKRYFLLFILLLAFILRVIWIDRLPSGFTPDEASFGYNAYCLLKTGADEWGHKFPIILESFGDFKSPLFSYLLIPFVAIGGLNKISVRLPNAIVGTLAVFATYLLVLELSRSKKLALISSFLLSISSWHIMMSRGGFEANLTTFFLPIGIYFLLKSRRTTYYILLAAVFLGLNLFSYHAAKIVTPLILLTFLFIYRKEFTSLKKRVLVIGGLIFSVFFAITIYSFAIGAGTRASDISIFNGTLKASAGERMKIQALGVSPFVARIFENKYLLSLKRFTGNYFSYFSPRFLFTDGPAEYTYGMLPGHGVLYWFELPFLIGFIFSFAKTKEKAFHFFILAWLIIAPIPAALASGPGYAGNRAEIIIPGIYLALALGVVEVFSWIRNKKLIYLYGAISFIFFTSFLFDYFVSSPAKASKDMLYGNLEMASFLSKNVDKSTPIVVDKGISEPHIYIAFANSWDPKGYQEATKNWNYINLGVNWVDQMPEYRLGNYVFKSVHFEEYKDKPNVYLVARPDLLPTNIIPVKKISYPNGDTSLLIVNSSSKVYAKAN